MKAVKSINDTLHDAGFYDNAFICKACYGPVPWHGLCMRCAYAQHRFQNAMTNRQDQSP